MKFQKAALAAVLGMGLCSALAGHVYAASEVQNLVPNELLVKYKKDAVRAERFANALYADYGVARVRHLRGLMKDVEQWKLKDGVDLEATLKKLRAEPGIASAEPNYVIEMPRPIAKGLYDRNGTLKGNDPCLGLQSFFNPQCRRSLNDSDLRSLGGWGGGTQKRTPPPNIQQPGAEGPEAADPQLSGVYGLDRIEAPQAWKTAKGDRQMIVAVIDTGLDYNHQDIIHNVWRNSNPTRADAIGYNFFHNDGLPYDDAGHGTHTAGTIGATGNNGIGISGVAPRVSIMPLKFLGPKGSGSTSAAIEAINYAVTHGARILNNSWGGPSGGTMLEEAIRRAKDQGVLFVASAGNSAIDNDNSSQKAYPAAYSYIENVISVAATGANDELARFSNYGSQSVQLGAPGVDVLSLVPRNYYAKMSGTSMAAPMVSGAAALIWSKYPKLTYLQVKKALLDGVDVVGALSGKTSTGGRLNVRKSLAIAASMATAQP